MPPNAGDATRPRAIETVYNGYRFRSRLEARWAVFFDALGLRWEYEREGFDLGKHGWYLPDFWLVDEEFWVEIKPDDHEALDGRLYILALQSGQPVFYLCGNPWPGDYHGYSYYRDTPGPFPFSRLAWIARPRVQLMFDSADFRDGWTIRDEESWVADAYRAARGARFEHGEQPQVGRRQVVVGQCKAGFELHRRGRRIPPDLRMCAECGEIEFDTVEYFDS